MAFPILATKLSPPAQRDDVVMRLEGLLAGIPLHRLTLVSAPAGFGKTTLIAAWLGSREITVAWVSLDAGDNAPRGFALYLLHALKRLHPSAFEPLISSLSTPQPPPFDVVVSHIINETARWEEPLILVLDDTHLIEHAEIWDGLNRLIENLPPALHFVLITREDPPLPLARLRAQGDLLEIRAGDLRFTTEETADFFHNVMRLDLPPALVGQLEKRTEGWVAGLQLAGISLRGEDDPAAFVADFSGSHRFVLDYLTDEVLAMLADPIREFLLQTAILPRLSVPLCEAVTGLADSNHLLRQIEEMNLFLIPLDYDRQWYRYHHLFADMLLKQLHQTMPALVMKLHRRAAHWFAEQGYTPEAIAHFAQAEDYDSLADLLEGITLDVVMRGNLQLALDWITLLPGEVLMARPHLAMVYSWALFLTGDLEPIGGLMDRIEAHPAVTQGTLGEAAAMRAFLSVDDPTRMKAYALKALDIVPDDNVMVRGLVHTALGNVHRHLGEQHAALDQLKQAVPFHWEAGNRVAAADAILAMVTTCMYTGRWPETATVIQSILTRARLENALDDPAIGMASIGRGWVLLYQYRLDEAVHTLNHGLELAQSGGAWSSGFGQFALAYAYTFRGELEAAQATLTDLEAAVEGMHQPELAARLAQVLMVLGNLEATQRWISLAAGSRIAPLIDARLSVLKGTSETPVLDALNRLIEQARTSDWAAVLTEGLMLRACMRRERSTALVDLREAVQMAEASGDLFTLLTGGAAVRDLLTGLADDPFAARLLEAFAAQPSPQPFGHPFLAEPLSQREQQVLLLMAEGLTYNAIAERLTISVNTVRYHVKGLYGKLGASSKAEALAAAREMNILP